MRNLNILKYAYYLLSNTLLLSIVFSLLFSCSKPGDAQLSEEQSWKLGWRMIYNSMNDQTELAEAQFDSILNMTDVLEDKFIMTGLKLWLDKGMDEEVNTQLDKLSPAVLKSVCCDHSFSELKPCLDICIDSATNKTLQLELVEMYIEDQAVRGNLETELAERFGIDISKRRRGAVAVDSYNRNRLKEIIDSIGFPTKEMVGKTGMSSVFFIIQHADGDKKWQRQQLPLIEKSVEKGDMDPQSYAYLYDRIKINAGEKQLYGTQFSHVDMKNKTLELAPVEDPEHLDDRRRKFGMMPIDLYKKMMFLSE